MNIRKIIQEEMDNNVVINILGNEYIVVRNNELKPYGKNYITKDEYDDLASFMDGIGITVSKFNYYEDRSTGQKIVASMRYKMREETLKRYIDIMGGEIDFLK